MTATLVPSSTGVRSNTTAARHTLVGLPPHERQELALADLLDDGVPDGAVGLDVRSDAAGPKIERDRSAEPRCELIGIGEQVPGLVSAGLEDDFTFNVHPASIVQLSVAQLIEMCNCLVAHRRQTHT